jgi:hypothetical protein
MNAGAHAASMVGGILVLVFLLVIGPLAVLYGADSRPVDDRDRRGWWPGAPRRRP